MLRGRFCGEVREAAKAEVGPHLPHRPQGTYKERDEKTKGTLNSRSRRSGRSEKRGQSKCIAEKNTTRGARGKKQRTSKGSVNRNNSVFVSVTVQRPTCPNEILIRRKENVSEPRHPRNGHAGKRATNWVRNRKKLGRGKKGVRWAASKGEKTSEQKNRYVGGKSCHGKRAQKTTSDAGIRGSDMSLEKVNSEGGPIRQKSGKRGEEKTPMLGAP